MCLFPKRRETKHEEEEVKDMHQTHANDHNQDPQEMSRGNLARKVHASNQDPK